MYSYSPTIAPEQQFHKKAFHSLNKRIPFAFYASKQVLLQRIVPRTRQLGVGITDVVGLANVAFCEVNPKLGVEDILVLLIVVRFDG